MCELRSYAHRRVLQQLQVAIRTPRENLASITTAEACNRIAEQYVGPMAVQRAGGISQMQLPPAGAEGKLQSKIAGEGFEPSTSGL